VTSDNSLLLILRRLDEIERKLDDMEELRTTRAIRRRWQRGTNVWRKGTSPARGPMRLRKREIPQAGLIRYDVACKGGWHAV